jgi:N-carbamoylputrescine amidase
MGHSAANIIPVIAANRIGEEVGESCTLTFYGSSFITDHTGEKVSEASRDKEEILYGDIDPKAIREHRHYWGLIRDRRPECYGKLTEPK